MSGRIIEIIVARSGSTQVQTRGFTGSSCLETSYFIAHALGQTTSEWMTPEYFQVNRAQQHRGFARHIELGDRRLASPTSTWASFTQVGSLCPQPERQDICDKRKSDLAVSR
jgi:hypothetical protein